MVETLTVSEVPRVAYLEDWWVCVVAPLLASWGFLMSAVQLVPLIRRKHALPDKHETVLSRYRLHIPKKVEEGEDEEATSVTSPQQSVAASRTSSSNDLEGEPPPEESSSPRNKRRRDSIFSIFGASPRKNATRARSGSDPTGRGPGLEAFYERAARRVRKYMNFAGKFAATPTRPIMRRARSVIQKSMAARNSSIRSTDDVNDGVGVGDRDETPRPRRRKLFESTRIRTKRVFKRSRPAFKKNKQANVQVNPNNPSQGREEISEDTFGDNHQANAGRQKPPRRRFPLFQGTRT